MEIPKPMIGRKAKYNFGLLKTGENLFIPATSADDRHRARSAAYTFAKSHGVKLVTRCEEQNGAITGLRVWRTE